MDTYKENLLTNARHAMRQTGGKIIVRGKNNERHVTIQAKDGQRCVVWYPTDSRINDCEVQDLKDAVEWIAGTKLFAP